MAEYLLLFRGGAGDEARQSPEKWQAHMQKWMQWMGKLNELGKFVGAQPLKPEGKVLKAFGKTVTDGPFIEGMEMVGGYLICKADSYDEAVTLAKDCPVLGYESGVVEVRAIQEMQV